MRKVILCTLALLLGLETAFAFTYRRIVEQASTKTVKIGIITPLLDQVNMKGTGTEKRANRYVGSGAFISPDGTILTAAHLFDDGAAKIFVKTDTGHVFNARIVRRNRDLDLALLKIDTEGEVSYFKLGHDLEIGQQVMTAGSPLAIQGVFTFGQVERLNFQGEFTLIGAPINPGNSGGPLIDMSGRLVGVNVAMLMMNPLVPAQSLNMSVNLETIRGFLGN